MKEGGRKLAETIPQRQESHYPRKREFTQWLMKRYGIKNFRLLPS
jgi:hypothetical protein